MKRSTIPIAAAFLAFAIGTATAQTPPQPQPVDPVGSFEFTTAVQGQTVSGVITILKGEDGALAGKILTDATPEIVIKSVTVEGKKLTIGADMPEGALTLVLEFEDANKFAGHWTLGGDGGAITGKRKV